MLGSTKGGKLAKQPMMAMSRSQRSQLFVPVTFLLVFYIVYLHLRLGTMTDDVDALEKTGPTGLWMSTTPGKDQGKIPRSRIAMACVNTDETSYDHLAMSNKHGMKKKKKLSIDLVNQILVPFLSCLD